MYFVALFVRVSFLVPVKASSVLMAAGGATSSQIEKLRINCSQLFLACCLKDIYSLFQDTMTYNKTKITVVMLCYPTKAEDVIFLYE